VIEEGQDHGRDLAGTKTLVQQDKVFALLPVMTAAFAGADYLESSPRGCPTPGGPSNRCGATSSTASASPAQTATHACPTRRRTSPRSSRGCLRRHGQGRGRGIRLRGQRLGQERCHPAQAQLGGRRRQDRPDRHERPHASAVVGDYTPLASRIPRSSGGAAPDIVVLSVGDSAGLSKKLSDLGNKGVVQGFSLYDPPSGGVRQGLRARRPARALRPTPGDQGSWSPI